MQEVNILNPKIPVEWRLYAPSKPVEQEMPSTSLLPENWPLTIPILSNLNPPEKVDWSPVITPEFQLILDNLGQGLFPIRYTKSK